MVRLENEEQTVVTDPHVPPAIASRTLQASVADLQDINFWQGFRRFTLLGSIVLGCLTVAWMTHSAAIFWSSTVVAGIFYAFWLICTHDAIHHTLFGWPALEHTLARLISWPMLWPVGVYSELHRLHHGWNGLDLRDPERVQWSEQEYEQASPLTKWYVRHQWVIDIFILGGLGIIAKTLLDGRRLQSLLPRLKFQLLADLLGMTAVQACLITVVVLTHTSLFRYLLFWLCLERVIGAIGQARAHLEHYGLWHQVGGHQLTQLYSSRNLQASSQFSWLVGGLNYHAVHHAFPGIPFDRLPEAHSRIQAVLNDHGMPAMEMEKGYPDAVRRLINQMILIPGIELEKS